MWEFQQTVTNLERADLVGLIFRRSPTTAKQLWAHTTPGMSPIRRDRLIWRNAYFDPCVGSGAYLVAADDSERLESVLQDCLVGTDIDPLAVLATKLNLMLDYGEVPMKPLKVEVTNSLTDGLSRELQADGFDLVMTNPPWGARLSNGELRALSGAF